MLRMGTVVINLRGREDNAAFRVHAGSSGAAHQVLEITNFDAVRTLLGARDEQVLDRKVDALGKGRSADYHAGQVFLHSMLDRQSDSGWRVGMVREHSGYRWSKPAVDQAEAKATTLFHALSGLGATATSKAVATEQKPH